MASGAAIAAPMINGKTTASFAQARRWKTGSDSKHTAPAEEKPETRLPDRSGQRKSEQRLLRDEFPCGYHRVFCPDHGAQQRNRRKAVADLPNEVGKKKGE